MIAPWHRPTHATRKGIFKRLNIEQNLAYCSFRRTEAVRLFDLGVEYRFNGTSTSSSRALEALIKPLRVNV